MHSFQYSCYLWHYCLRTHGRVSCANSVRVLVVVVIGLGRPKIEIFCGLFFFERANNASTERELERILNLPYSHRVMRGHNRLNQLIFCQPRFQGLSSSRPLDERSWERGSKYCHILQSSTHKRFLDCFVIHVPSRLMIRTVILVRKLE